MVIKGTAKHYITGIVGMTDGKISRIIFERYKEDEAALNKRTGGIVDITMNEAVYQIRGTVGTTVTLTVIWDGTVFDVAIERK